MFELLNELKHKYTETWEEKQTIYINKYIKQFFSYIRWKQQQLKIHRFYKYTLTL
jgi:hypothetical protein